jgi:hypothetical protein
LWVSKLGARNGNVNVEVRSPLSKLRFHLIPYIHTVLYIHTSGTDIHMVQTYKQYRPTNGTDLHRYSTDLHTVQACILYRHAYCIPGVHTLKTYIWYRHTYRTDIHTGQTCMG